jgi:hypothetical protein
VPATGSKKIDTVGRICASKPPGRQRALILGAGSSVSSGISSIAGAARGERERSTAVSGVRRGVSVG